jgi:hypothetical protein
LDLWSTHRFISYYVIISMLFQLFVKYGL